jgi:hypothetical protein
VVTVKGRLEFTVTNGGTFIIEPGIVLLANDMKGNGHSWKILDGKEWHRIYLVTDLNAEEYFKPTVAL